MRKGQSFVLQFIFFFSISFSLFAIVSYFFYSQNEFFKERISESTSTLMNDLILFNSMKGSVECKACDSMYMIERIPSRIGGFFYTIEMGGIGLNATILSPKPFSDLMPTLNLNETFTFSGKSLSENKRIGIEINNTDKIIKVS